MGRWRFWYERLNWPSHISSADGSVRAKIAGKSPLFLAPPPPAVWTGWGILSFLILAAAAAVVPFYFSVYTHAVRYIYVYVFSLEDKKTRVCMQPIWRLERHVMQIRRSVFWNSSLDGRTDLLRLDCVYLFIVGISAEKIWGKQIALLQVQSNQGDRALQRIQSDPFRMCLPCLLQIMVDLVLFVGFFVSWFRSVGCGFSAGTISFLFVVPCWLPCLSFCLTG